MVSNLAWLERDSGEVQWPYLKRHRFQRYLLGKMAFKKPKIQNFAMIKIIAFVLIGSFNE